MSEQTRSYPAQLLKSEDAARVLAISPRKLWELTAAKEIECVRIGKCVRYSYDALQRFIDSQKVKTSR